MRFLLLAILPLFSAVNSDGDWQFWQHTNTMGTLRKNLRLNTDIELRFGDDITKAYYVHAQMLLVYNFNPTISWGSGYRQTFVRTTATSEEWKAVYEPMTNITLSWKRNGWKIDNRHQVQFLLFDPKYHPNAVLYRNRLQVTAPWNWSGIHPYASFEAFYWQRKGINQLRGIVGVGKKVNDTFSFYTYYLGRGLMQKERWTYQNIIGLFLGFNF